MLVTLGACLFSRYMIFCCFLVTSEVKTYNPAADSTIPTPGKKRKRSEENGDSTPAPSVPDTPSTPAAEEGPYPRIKLTRTFWM